MYLVTRGLANVSERSLQESVSCRALHDTDYVELPIIELPVMLSNRGKASLGSTLR